jgi:APA family basic amino acid/polyamine antiporter
VRKAREEKGRLLAVLGTAFGISIVIGNTIGSGILRTPGEIARLLGDSRLFILIWIAGAVYSLLGANAFAELATMTPESGGHTVYVRRALGQYAGFLVGWTDWLSTCGSMAVSALVIGESARAFLPLQPAAGATLVAVGFALVQWRGVRSAGNAQEVTALAKALAFGLLIVACLAVPVAARAPVAATSPTGAWALTAALVVAMQGVIFTYDGYYGVVYFGGELKDPAREIPRSIFGGVVAVAAVYLLVNFGFLRVLGISRMAGDPLVAASAAREIFGDSGGDVVRLVTIVALFSSVNAFQLMASRILYRLGARGFVARASAVNSGGTPTVSLLITTLAALLMIWTGTFEKVLAWTAFLFVGQYALDFLSLLVLRVREPAAPRPFRARGHPWTTWGVFLLSLGLLAGAAVADLTNTALSLGLVALSVPVYLVLRRRAEPKAQA